MSACAVRMKSYFFLLTGLQIRFHNQISLNLLQINNKGAQEAQMLAHQEPPIIGLEHQLK